MDWVMARHMPEPGTPATLRPARGRTVRLLAVALFFLILGLLPSSAGAALRILDVLCFGTCAVVFAIQLARGSTYLRINDNGFVVRTMFRTTAMVPWSAVTGFAAGYIPPAPQRFVVYDVDPADPRLRVARQVARTFARHEAALPDTYGLSADELADLLNGWRILHGTAQPRTPHPVPR
jgi:hypothetical protein